MPRREFFHARSHPKRRAIAGATVTAALVAAFLTQVSDHGPAASATPSRIPTVEEMLYGLITEGDRYPGGLPALLDLFGTGECAGTPSYESAPAPCRSLVDRIILAGAGQLPVFTAVPGTGATFTEITEISDLPTTLPPTPPPGTSPPTMPPPTPPPGTIPPAPPPTMPPTMPPPPGTTPPTTPPVMPPPQPLPPLLVAVGDSVTSGHEARQAGNAWRTTCDDPATSWAEDLRVLLGVPQARYYNFAHSGASTTEVLTGRPYTNPCGVVSQQNRSQLDDAIAVLRANPSRAGAANVSVATVGINDTNWVNVATLLVRHRLGAGLLPNSAPDWAVANVQACTDWSLGNPNGNMTPGAPRGAILPAWDGQARALVIMSGVARIALGLIDADPGGQVRQALYYKWAADANLPANCVQAAHRATDLLNWWITVGVASAKLLWWLRGGDQTRISMGCERTWNNGPQFVQMRLMSDGVPNGVRVPGWPHPNAGGRAALAGCVNGLLPRAPGGGVG